MARFFIDKQYNIGDTFDVTDSIKQHIMALRLNVNSYIEVFNGNGSSYLAKLIDINRKFITITILEKIAPSINSNNHLNVVIDLNNEIKSNISPKITLAMSIINPDKMDLVVQKATELNIYSIIPIITKRTQQITDSRLLKRKQHWQNIVISSSEQCGRNELLLIKDPTYLTDYLSTYGLQNDKTNNKNFILSPLKNLNLTDDKKDAFDIKDFSITISKDKTPNNIMLMVGPEGGFTDDELSNAIDNNFIPLSLGENILRAETATIVAITTIQLLYNWCLFGIKNP